MLKNPHIQTPQYIYFISTGLRVFRVEECWTNTRHAYWQIRANFEPPNTSANTSDGGMNASGGVSSVADAGSSAGGVDGGSDGRVNGDGADADADADADANANADADADGEVNTGTAVADAAEERTVSQVFDDLAQLSEKWMAQVRANECEKYPGQLRDILQSLGPLPPPGSPADRVMWYAALLNPLPALGVAPEIRPAVLAATGNVRHQQAIVTKGFQISLEYVNGYPVRVWVSRALLVLIVVLVLYLLLEPELGFVKDREGVEAEGTFSLEGDDMESLSEKGFYEL